LKPRNEAFVAGATIAAIAYGFLIVFPLPSGEFDILTLVNSFLAIVSFAVGLILQISRKGHHKTNGFFIMAGFIGFLVSYFSSFVYSFKQGISNFSLPLPFLSQAYRIPLGIMIFGLFLSAIGYAVARRSG
jgi:hypothetical protein